jgi:hypothetical protein
MNDSTVPQYPIPAPPFGWGATPPANAGAYWFLSEDNMWAIVVDVSLKNGQLCLRWLDQEIPLTELRGLWRGPLQLISEPSQAQRTPVQTPS